MPTNLTRISRFGFVNAYLVSEDDGLTLVDTLVPRSAKAVLRRGRGLGAPIVRIALTHAHGDHVGSLDELAAALPGVEVLISARDARLLPRTCPSTPASRSASCAAATRGPRRAPTRTLAAGDMVGSLEVVAAPGHTPGHVAFFDRRDGTLLCGDAYTTLGGVATTDKVRLPFPLARWRRGTPRPSSRAPAPCARWSRPPGPWPRPHRRGRRPPRWTRRWPRRPSRCPGAGLDPERVVDAAAAIADAEGLDAVTLARVAGGLGVRAPSLYNHVDGRGGLLRAAGAARRCAS